MACKYIYKGNTYTKEEFETFVKENIVKKSPENKFLNLLGKDNQWVIFFLKSIVQDSAKQGYEKVWFPTGDTASKVEGHQTLEEFKHQEEKRLEQLENKKKGILTKRWFTEEIGGGKEHDFKTKEKALEFISKQDFPEDWANPYEKNLQDIPESDLHNVDKEIEHIKQNLERIEKEGFGLLKPIYNFYETTVGNILKKQYKDQINRVTDEFGNQWWELSIDRNRDLTDILFQLSTPNLPKSTQITPEIYQKLKDFTLKLNPNFKVETLNNLLETKGANGLADLENFVIQLQAGKESALAEEVAHFFFEMLPLDHPLRKSMMSDITHTRMYKMIRNHPDYQKLYKGDTDLLKREAAAKLISLYLTDKELFNHYAGSANLIESLVRWIKDFLRWVKGQKKAVGDFIHSAKKITNLDTSDLAVRQLRDVQFFSLGEAVREAFVLKSVRGLNVRPYNKIYINISDTIFNTSLYDFKGRKKEILLNKKEEFERGKFFKEVPLTTLGVELRDKILAIGSDRIILYTKMFLEPALIDRIQKEFGNVTIIRVDQTDYIENEQGEIIKETLTNTIEEKLKQDKEAGIKSVVIGNSKLTFEDKEFQSEVNYWNYNEARAENYEPYAQRIRNMEETEKRKKKISTLVEELKRINSMFGDEEPVVSKIQEAFRIIKGSEENITRLEERLEKAEIDEEEYLSVFRNEYGDLLLPTSKAIIMKRLLDEIDGLEESIKEFVGTLEAVTKFFEERNRTNYQTISDLIEKGDEKSIDIALQELMQITRMGRLWKDYINHFREYTSSSVEFSALLGEIDSQISQTNTLARQLSKKAIGNKLSDSFDLINRNLDLQIKVYQEKLDQTQDEQERLRLKENIALTESRKVGAEDVIDILNGNRPDIDGMTMWVKTLHNSGDPIIGSIGKIIKKSIAEVDVDAVREGQLLGEKVREIQEKYGISDKEYQDRIVITGYTWIWEKQPGSEKAVLVKKPRLELLSRYKNFDKRFEMQQPFIQAYQEYQEAKENKSPDKEEKFKAYIEEKRKFELWETENWHREYTPEFYRRFDELRQDEELYQEAVDIYRSIYREIEDLTRSLQYVTEFEETRLINEQIKSKERELKILKKEVHADGTPKEGKELEISKILKRKSEIDREYFEYSSDFNRFRSEFLKFINTLDLRDEVRANLALHVQGENYSTLLNYAKQNAPYEVRQWLDLNTVFKIDPLWYEERKTITDKISEVITKLAGLQSVDVSEDLNERWKKLFTLTSDLRDENGIFDGSDATPEVQRLVKELEQDIENLKKIARESNKDDKSPALKALKSQLRGLIKQLQEIQSRTVTESYYEELFEMAESTGFGEHYNSTNPNFPLTENTNPLEVINSDEFHSFLQSNEDHPFVTWFNNNHIEKEKQDAFGETIIITEPTYIWFKIQPTDSSRIFTVPSNKYSKRTVKKEYQTEKTAETWHPILRWLPKNPEFFNEDWYALNRSSNPKDVGIALILKEITDFHLKTQESTSVTEGKIGFGLPYVQKMNHEEGAFKNYFNSFIDKRNRFEQGEGNYNENEPEAKTNIRGIFNNLVNNVKEFFRAEGDPYKSMRIAVPYVHYISPEENSKDVLLTSIMFRASTSKADRMLKNLPVFNLIEDIFLNPPKSTRFGRIANSNENRLAALRFQRDHWAFGVNKQYELGQGVGRVVDRGLMFVRKINTYGSLGFPFGLTNIVKNNLQGRLQNIIGANFGNWSSKKSMRRAFLNQRLNFGNFLAEAQKPLNQRSLDFQIMAYFNSALDQELSILLKGGANRVMRDSPIMFINKAMEYSIGVNLLYGHLYHQSVKKGNEQKTLYDILSIQNGEIKIEEGWTDSTGKPIDKEYLLETKLAYQTVSEYVQGRIQDKTYLSTTTIGQAILYFKNWLIPMLRRRFDYKKRANYMIGEYTEGYWTSFVRMSYNMIKDYVNHGKTYWGTFSEEEKQNYITTLNEIAFMMLSLALITLVLGFDMDDPDKFKKLEEAPFYYRLAVLLAIQAKNETEALSAMPFFNLEQSAVPTVLTEGVRWVTNPTIGLSIIDNTWKTINYSYALIVNSDNAYYDRNMPQFGIEKGDTKAAHYLKKILQIDDLLNQFTPEDKLRSVISMMRR